MRPPWSWTDLELPLLIGTLVACLYSSSLLLCWWACAERSFLWHRGHHGASLRKLSLVPIGLSGSPPGLSKTSAGALFTDIKGAYYVIRQYVVGSVGPDDQFRSILARLNLGAGFAEEALRLINLHGSLLQQGATDPALVSFLRDLNEATSFVVDGTDQIAQTARGARPEEALALLGVLILFAKFTKVVRETINLSEFRVTLPFSSTGMLSAQ